MLFQAKCLLFVIGSVFISVFFACQSAAAQTCAPAPAGLVDFWPGDNTANDLQGGNNGTLESNTTFAAGEVGPAFSFDGASDVAIPSLNIGSAFTVEFWVYPTRNGGFEHLVSNAYLSTNYGAIYFLNGRIEYLQANIGAISTAAASVPLNAWTHVAVTYDGNAGAGNRFARIYLNGVLSATSVDHLETFNNALKFGYAVSGTDSKFKGLLDEVSLYNQALSAADILSISNAGIEGKCVASSVFVNDVSVAEGNAGTTTASFTVSALRHADAVTFDYATADNTATAPSDYQSTSGPVLIPATGTTATINVTVNGDTTFEPDETFFVNLSNVTGASVTKGQAVGTIINDECFAAPANMVSWWPAESNANDIQGGNNGILENGVAFAAGEVGQAFSFNGTNSVLTPTINIGSAFTTELWIFPTSSSFFQHLVSNDSATVTNYGALYYNANHVEYWSAQGARVSSPAVPLNTWTHVALTYDGSADRLYINGGLVATSSGAHSENFNNALRFGYSIKPQDSHFQGGLDEITLYSRALSGPEVQSLSTHNTGKCSSTPTAGPATVSGLITREDGSPLAGAVMHLSGATSRTTITDANGLYHFDNLDAGNFYSVTASLANYRFTPASRSMSLLGNTTQAVFTGNPDRIVSANAIDTTEYFVRQQYLDFLGREPDQDGFEYWSSQINQCNGDAACIRQRRIDVSAAFFASAEFQQTGAYVYGLYAGTLGRTPGFAEFNPDRLRVVGGAGLAQARTGLAESFVQRSEFTNRYPQSLTRELFVDAVLQSMQQRSGADMSVQRDALLDAYDTGGRAQVVTQAAAATAAIEYNKAFVLMEYFGYLRRDVDQGGYDFWLNILNNRDLGNYRGMVCSFVTSVEYQQRFSTVVLHNNSECSGQ